MARKPIARTARKPTTAELADAVEELRESVTQLEWQLDAVQSQIDELIRYQVGRADVEDEEDSC